MTDRTKGKRKKRYRGKRSHGRGNTKGGRGKGSRMATCNAKGGRNYAHYLKKEKKKEKGMSGKPSQEPINLRDLEKIPVEEGKLDVTKHGYEKVLGGGNITQKLTITAKSFSQSAKEKIEKAGGKTILKGE